MSLLVKANADAHPRIPEGAVCGAGRRTCTGRPPLRVGWQRPGRGGPWRAVAVVSAVPWGRRPWPVVSSVIWFCFRGPRLTRGCGARHTSCLRTGQWRRFWKVRSSFQTLSGYSEWEVCAGHQACLAPDRLCPWWSGLLAGATLCPVDQYLLERSWLCSSLPSSRCYCGGHISVLRARKWRRENCSLQSRGVRPCPQ